MAAAQRGPRGRRRALRLRLRAGTMITRRRRRYRRLRHGHPGRGPGHVRRPPTRCCWAPSAVRSGTSCRRRAAGAGALPAAQGAWGCSPTCAPWRAEPALIDASPLRPERLARRGHARSSASSPAASTSGPQGGGARHRRRQPRRRCDTLPYSELEIRRIVRAGLRAGARPAPQGHQRRQGQCPRHQPLLAAHRRRGRPRVPGRQARAPPGGLLRHAAHHQPGRLRRDGDREPVRRHPVGRGVGAGRLAGHAALRLAG